MLSIMTIYYPILNNGKMEMEALSEYYNDDSGQKNNMIPVLQAPSKKIEKDWERKFNTAGTYLKSKIGSNPFVYQFSSMFETVEEIHNIDLWKVESPRNPVELVLDKFDEQNLDYSICLSVKDPDWIWDSIARVNPYKIYIRVELYEIPNEVQHTRLIEINGKIRNKFPSAEVNLIIDCFDHLNDYDSIKRTVIFFKEKKYNVIFAGTTCPTDVKKVKESSFQKFSDRTELDTFFKLLQDNILIDFADYTVRIKSEIKIDQITLKTTYFKLFYSTQTELYIGKSGLIGKQGDDGRITIQELCQIIISSPQYFGSTFSWGDLQILKCSKGELEIKNHNKPISIGVNHHLVLTSKQISQL